MSAADAGRPPLANSSAFVRIAESWTAPPAGTTTRTIHVLASTPFVSLSLNGAAPVIAAIPFRGSATFTVTWAPGTLVAAALASNSTGATPLATHSIAS
jgi:hypothetical protein